MNILVLYSWEEEKGRKNDAQSWAMALCYEINAYQGMHAECDVLFRPKSCFKGNLEKKIHDIDKIIVIVTHSYCQKIAEGEGVAAWEEKEYKKRIEKEKDSNTILFIKKEGGSLPAGWDGHCSFDLSWLTIAGYNSKSKKQSSIDLQEQMDSIVRFLQGVPEYQIIHKKVRKIPTAKSAIPFKELLDLKDKTDTIGATRQPTKQDLIRYIRKNLDQQNFVKKYIQSGPSAKSNFGGYITPELFEKYFMVKRPPNLDIAYKEKIRDLFRDPDYNMLCVQSDGGSGKSVFINSLYLKDEKNVNRYRYEHCLIDFEHSNSLLINRKEELLQQRVRKLYQMMCRGSNKDSYILEWRKNFLDMLDSLTSIVFPETEYNFLTNQELKEGVNEAVSILRLPNDYDDWNAGSSNRINQLNAALTNEKYGQGSHLYFVILLLLLIILYNTRPQPERGKKERYIIIFDNIETFDCGNRNRRISQFVDMCHNIIDKIFDELALGDDFYLKFTFVIVLRTSTVALFGDLASDIYNGNQNIISLEFHDFTLEALLKKLEFLHNNIPNANGSRLYTSLSNIISLFVPKSSIKTYLYQNNVQPGAMTYFAANQLLPFFNNNFRTVTKHLGDIFADKETGPILIDLLSKVNSTYDNFSNYVLNGARMIVMNSIFTSFHRHGIFRHAGFSDLHGDDNHSMARTILAYLYWNKTQFLSAGGREQAYKGVKLSVLLDTFKYFCSEELFTKILFDLSIYTREIPERQAALKAWGNLLVFSGAKEKLTENALLNAVSFYLHPEKTKSNNKINTMNCEEITVRLSKAGICFTQYYVRSFEFLSARDERNNEGKALYAIDNNQYVLDRIDCIHGIITNCIEKLLQSCEKTCKLYKGEGNVNRCVMDINKHTPELFSCSLFLRFQECMDLIREAIDYIDRYRIVRYISSGNSDFNKALICKLKGYYALYDYAKEKLRNMKGNIEQINGFLSNWEYPKNMVYRDISTEDYDHRSRPIKDYYVQHGENIEKAVSIIDQSPSKSLYDALYESI